MSEHECVFPEEQEPSGRLILAPCLVCGCAAMDAMNQLRSEAEWVQPVLEDLAPRLSWWAGRVTDAPVEPLTEDEAAELSGLLLEARNAKETP